MSDFMEIKEGNSYKVKEKDLVKTKIKVFKCNKDMDSKALCNACAAASKNPIQIINTIEFRVGSGEIHDYIDKKLVGLKVGGLYRFFLTPEDAFEEVGIKNDEKETYYIAPGQSICFEIEIDEIIKNLEEKNE